ncbi:TonB-dependent receptor [Parabacteroides sp. OttesenSCG-928-G07]|nr:TonB-dependent receptor [Parabacteroides sp. OttesenSCG-928-G07]
MQKMFLFLLLLFVSQGTLAQESVDTTIVLQQIDIKGVHFSGISGGEIKRLQVDKNLTSLTGTTSEALRQIPSVTTDIEGAVLFRGSNHTGMLINGVPYGLLEENRGDVLIQLPALFYDQLSLRSFVPIEWMPDGDAGSLNFSSSLLSEEDSPFILTTGMGWNDRYNIGAVLNVHPGKFHIIGKYNYRHEYRMRKFQKTTTNDAGTTVMNNSASARPDVHLTDLYVGYDWTDSDMFSLYGMYYLMDYGRYGGINNTRYNPAGEVLSKVLRHRFNNQRQDTYAVEARWTHRFNDPENKFELVFNYNNFIYDEDNHYENENTQGVIVVQDDLNVGQLKDNYYISGIYQKTFTGNLTFKAGYTGRFRQEHYTSEAFDLKDDNWLANPQKTDDFSFDKYTNLLFLNVEKTWDKLVGEIGVQAEHTWQKANEVENNYIHFYPRLKAVFQATEHSELILSYQQRVIRPDGAAMNSFINRSDATHIVQGNPDLKDEYIHSVEVSYPINDLKIHFTPALYYRYKSNRIMETVYQENDVAVWKKENVGNSNTFGAEVSVTWLPTSFISIGFMANLYRDEIDARQIGYTEKKSLFCWDMKSYISLHITPTTALQLDGFYISDQLTPQGEVKNRSSVNVGLSQYFWEKKLRVNLSLNNLFDDLKEVTTINSPDIQMKQIRNRDVRVSWLNLTYYM